MSYRVPLSPQKPGGLASGQVLAAAGLTTSLLGAVLCNRRQTSVVLVASFNR